MPEREQPPQSKRPSGDPTRGGQPPPRERPVNVKMVNERILAVAEHERDPFRFFDQASGFLDHQQIKGASNYATTFHRFAEKLSPAQITENEEQIREVAEWWVQGMARFRRTMNDIEIGSMGDALRRLDARHVPEEIFTILTDSTEAYSGAFSEQTFSLGLQGLQNFKPNEATRRFVRALEQKLENLSAELSPRQLTLAIRGLRNFGAEDVSPEFIQELLNRIPEVSQLSLDDITRLLEGLQAISQQSTEIHSVAINLLRRGMNQFRDPQATEQEKAHFRRAAAAYQSR